MNWFMVSFIPAACAGAAVFVAGCLIYPPIAPVASVLVFLAAL